MLENKKNNSNNVKNSKKSKVKAQDIEHKEVVLKSLDQVLHESMMPYSEFVIMDRALPRVEDGLKPVQRRVLYSMLEVGVTPDKPYRKSATIVGECMGKYHPHGDRSIYDTMVRMAQSFNMREVLVDGHGNFGSVDGDSAAAMRYTEARLSPISLELLKDIEKDTVSWSFNFDDRLKEPDMLPGRFPNLLVNGSTGIAVGLATNIPTHNLGEAIDATIAYINNKNITLEEMLKVMPAPDFSTGGYILNTSEINQIYSTGKGKLIIRAKLHIENSDNGKKSIVITEIPYQVNKATMLQKIAKLKENDTSSNYSGIYEIVDESDRHGTRAVIKLKKDTNVNKLLKLLYKNTDLQTNFNVNMVAIAGGKPKLLNLLEIISYYVNYQKGVIYKRTKYDLDVSEKRAHILQGLLVAIKEIDKVIKIIRSSKSTNEAKTSLMSTFYLSDVQAQAILDMRLARLTSLEVNRIEKELAELTELINKLKRILESDKLQYNLIKFELNEIKERFASPRKSIIVDDETDELLTDKNENDSEVNDLGEEVNVIYSAGNTLKVVYQKNYNLSTKELSANATLFEVPQLNLITKTNKTIYIFTNLGNCHKLKVKDIPIAKFKDKGEFVYNLIKNFIPTEKIVAMYDFDEVNNSNDKLVFVTKNGLVKLTKIKEFFSSKQTIAAIKLKDETDEIVLVSINNDNDLVTVFTRLGFALSFEKQDITETGRVSMGVKAINLSDGDYVVNAYQNTPNSAFALFTSNGYAKVIKHSEVQLSQRARKGSKVISIKDKILKLTSAYLLDKNTSYVVKTDENELHYVLNKKMSLEDKGGAGKNTAGNKKIKLDSVFMYTVV